MIQRRGFFGKLAGLLGLSALPVQAGEESAERKLRREKMAAKGLGPDDVKIEIVWDHVGDTPSIRCYFDCHGETYGFMFRLDGLPEFLGVLVTPKSIKRITARTPRSLEKEDDKPRVPRVIDFYAEDPLQKKYGVVDADTLEEIILAITYADEGNGIIRFLVSPWMRDKALRNKTCDGKPREGLEFDEDGNILGVTGRGVTPKGYPWVEMRRRIKIIERLTPEQRFEAQAALT